jgi:hypothetical protein
MTPDDIKTARQWQHKFSVLLSDYQVYGPNDEMAGNVFEAACYIKDYLSMALSAIEAHHAELNLLRREARAAELEACIETVKTLAPWLSNYHSNVSSEPTRKDIIEALGARKYLPQ